MDEKVVGSNLDEDIFFLGLVELWKGKEKEELQEVKIGERGG